jgi:uncharacterized phage protein gp47/JayE
MAWQRPTLTDLIDRTKADMVSRIDGITSVLRRSVLGVLARVLAGACHELYGYLTWLSRQILPDTAETEYLNRWARIWKITRNAATYATGSVAFAGADGSVIPAGTELQRSDETIYTTDADGTIASGAATVQITASVAGENGNADAGEPLSLTSTVSGVTSIATASALTEGADQESDVGLRARLLTRIQEPPHGGADFDYVAWALETAGVTRAWCYPLWLGAGTVGVCFVRDLDASMIPDAAEIATVQAYIDAVRPVTAAVTVFAPTPVSLDLSITLTPNTSVAQAAVQAEIEDLLVREAEPEDGSGSGTILLSHIREAISIATGETDNTLTSPAANVTHSAGEIAVIGTITWG